MGKHDSNSLKTGVGTYIRRTEEEPPSRHLTISSYLSWQCSDWCCRSIKV